MDLKMESNFVSIIMTYRIRHRFQRDVTTRVIQNIQTFTENYELIIIDCASDPTSTNSISKLMRPEDKYLTFEENFGTAKAFNLGIREAKSDYIFIGANDIIYHQNWMNELFKYYDPNSQVKILCPTFSRFGSPDEYNEWTDEIIKLPINDWPKVQFSNLCNYFMEKKTYKEIGEFDENFGFFYMDNDYERRVEAKGIYCTFVPTSLITHLASMTWFYDGETHADDPKSIYNEGADKAYMKKKWNLE